MLTPKDTTEGQPKMVFPENVNGVPEFGSIILTIDHLANRKDGHVVQKMVLSTQMPTETLLALFRYYGEEELLTKLSTINILQEAALAYDPVFVYTTRENLQIMCSTATWDKIVQHPQCGNSSCLVAVDFLTKQVAQIHSDLANADKSSPEPIFRPLFMMALSFDGDIFDLPDDQPQDNSLAEDMLKTAAFQDVTTHETDVKASTQYGFDKPTVRSGSGRKDTKG